MRKRSAAVFAAEGEKGAFLVETLHGIRTVKALALDARRRHDWDINVAKAARLRFDEGRTANVVQTVVTPLERIMTSGVFALAVFMAIYTKEQVYVGALIAFMMLTQRVPGPLVQLAQLITQYDEVGSAVTIVGKLVNQPTEEGHAIAASAPRSSAVSSSRSALQIPWRDVARARRRLLRSPDRARSFGIVGRSGSGKTTVTRLLQRLHSDYEGLIKVDGDRRARIRRRAICAAVSAWCCRRTSCSAARSATTSRPPSRDATFDEVVRAARLAGAEEFIDRLPRGYDTYIYEGSPNLSGGQRQRLAIARALITRPAHPDPRRGDERARCRTARRSSTKTIRRIAERPHGDRHFAPAVVAGQFGRDPRARTGQGRGIGRHEELLERCDIYSGLWHQQNRHLSPGKGEVVSLPRGARG